MVQTVQNQRLQAPIYVDFNNDPHGCALRDASCFAEAIRRLGLDPSRTPPPLPLL